MPTLGPWLQQQATGLAIDLLRLLAWLAVLGLVFVPLERLFAHRRQKLLRPWLGIDLGYFFLSGLLPKLLLVLPLSLAAAGLHRLVPGAWYATVAAWPLLLRMAGALVIGEVGAYWAHRWEHDLPLLWRFHAVHHSAAEMDWLVNTRAHPVDLAFTRLCSLVPMYALGLAQPLGSGFDLVPIIVTLIGTAWGFFVHANIDWRFGGLEQLIATPAFHHWHHAHDGDGTVYQNFAPMLPWIDRCFGTLHLPRRDWPQHYGTETPVAPGLVGQLLAPLLPRRG